MEILCLLERVNLISGNLEKRDIGKNVYGESG